VLCRPHNRLAAEVAFGLAFMETRIDGVRASRALPEHGM